MSEPSGIGRTDGARLRSALWLPLFDELADPVAAAQLAAEAEQGGWDGFFVWDNLNWRAPVRQVADPWITLRPARARDHAVRHRDRRAARHRPGALREGGRHLVADGIRARGVAGPGARRDPRRPG